MFLSACGFYIKIYIQISIILYNKKSEKLKNIVQKYKDTRAKYIKLEIDDFPPL